MDRISNDLTALVADGYDVAKDILPRKGAVAFSGMAGVAVPKEVPRQLANYVRDSGEGFELTLLLGGSTSTLFEKNISAIKILSRFPGVSGRDSRNLANQRLLSCADMWLSEYSRFVRRRIIPRDLKLDCAVIEATEIQDGGIVLSDSIDLLPALAEVAEKIVIEVNTRKPVFFGLHDTFLPVAGKHIPISKVREKVGSSILKVPKKKIVAIVRSELDDEPPGAYQGTTKTDERISEKIAQILSEVVTNGIETNHRGNNALTLQLGAGPIASALSDKLPFRKINIWSEVLSSKCLVELQDKIVGATSSCLYTLPGEEKYRDEIRQDLSNFKNKIVLRPYEVTNSVEMIRVFDLISIQQAVEVDIYGNTNVSHINGDLYNGVGGSGEFTRASALTLLVLPSRTSDQKRSRIVPLTTHVDIPEHDIDIVVTEQGSADLRGLSPVERANRIINNCAYPDFRKRLADYLEHALSKGGHEPVDAKRAITFYE